MKLKAFAKINLGLDVVRKREDGYHEVRMIMQTVGIFDRLELKMRTGQGIQVSTNLSFLPNDENNLVYRAAKLLMDEKGIKDGISIQLEKHIPVAAGMAGGSSDAAAVLVGVNRMFEMGFSMRELMERGVKIGADVPYCVMRGTALSEGIGEVLTSLPPMPACSIVIAKPPVNVSTKFVYENLHAESLTEHPDIDGMVNAIRKGELSGITERMGNVLESVTEKSCPVIGELKAYMREKGALNALMSGSGPTVFGIFDDVEKAAEVRDGIREMGTARQVYLTAPVNPGAEQKGDVSDKA